jgi:hypothetical protein
MTARQASQLIRKFLNEHGLNNSIRARTVDFTDLARTSRVFVTIFEWEPSALAAEIEKLAAANSFFVQYE